MFERFHKPEEIFSHRLGAALGMEQTVLEMLGELEQQAQREEIKELLRHHADETRRHIDNVTRCFELLGEEVEEETAPTAKALEKEGQMMLKKTEDPLLDSVILSGAIETEHHEIAVYETLIIHAEARGATQVVDLLRQNLEQEQHTLEEVRGTLARIAHEGIAVAA